MDLSALKFESLFMIALHSWKWNFIHEGVNVDGSLFDLFLLRCKKQVRLLCLFQMIIYIVTFLTLLGYISLFILSFFLFLYLSLLLSLSVSSHFICKCVHVNFHLQHPYHPIWSSNFVLFIHALHGDFDLLCNGDYMKDEVYIHLQLFLVEMSHWL